MNLFRTNLTEAFTEEGADKIRAAARAAAKDGQRYAVTFKKDGKKVDWDIKIKGNRIMGRLADLVDPKDAKAMQAAMERHQSRLTLVNIFKKR